MSCTDTPARTSSAAIARPMPLEALLPVVAANRHELALQLDQFRSADFREGVAAMAERRAPVFERR